METLDIVALIEKNPLTCLNDKYQSELVNRIKNTFTDTQQHLFVASFYCYLNHDSKKDFVIDLADVWKWCGFGRIDPAKRLLVKHFVLDVDYKVLIFLNGKIKKAAPPKGGAAPPKGGIKK